MTSKERVCRAHRGNFIAGALGALAAVFLTGQARAQIVINVTDGASLSAAINTVDTVPNAAGYVINLQNNITLTNAANNTLNAFNTTSNVTVAGNGFTLDGGNVQRGFLVYSGTVAFSNLTISNAQALGGTSVQGAGGGAGLGGALFVASGGNVTVSNVTLLNNTAIGGAGGGAVPNGGGAGGGGMGGDGGGSGLGSGGGGVGLGANGGVLGVAGSPGIVVGGAAGGAGGAAGGASGGGGSGGTNFPFPVGSGGGGGVGGGAGTTGTGGNGGFGGGGGGGFTTQGGTGGFGGGGGSSFANGGIGGNGGFGGGGGGSGGVPGLPTNGGFGGGNSGAGDGIPGGNNGGGGGGAGMGGAIFVQDGGTLILAGPLSVNGNAVTGGAGGAPATPVAGGNGSAFGSGIFLQGNGTLGFRPGSGNSQTIADVITDQTGSGGTGANAGSWALNISGGGKLTLTAANSYTGGTTVAGGTLVLAGGGTLGATSGATTVAGGTLDLGGTTQIQNGGVTLAGGAINNGTLSSSGTFGLQSGTVSAVLAGSGGLTKTTSGTVVLTGANTYAGPTTVNGGALTVNGSIVSATTVNNGGTLGGSGMVRAVQVNAGGTFAPGTAGVPGTAMTVSGNLAFQSGAVYFVQVSPTTTSVANVTGNAMLGGNVLAAFAPGSYVARQYTILTSAGLGGTTFAGIGTTSLPAGFAASLSYTSTDVLLNLTATLGQLGTAGLNGNQQSVATALNNFFNGGGTLTPNFLTVFGLTGGSLSAALTQLSGEVGTGPQQATFNAMTQFLGVMTDPTINGRGDAVSAGGSPTG